MSSRRLEEDFEKVMKIGKGAFGEVYLVRNRSTGRHYAMKRIHTRLVAKERQETKLLTEREILSRLKHPGIIRLKQIFGNEFYIF
jgi:serine/threonine protein kinase